MTLSAQIIDRLKMARGPDRRIDRDILRLVSGRVVRDETWIGGPKDRTREIETAYPFSWACWFAPHYTSSVDAALSLCEPRISWHVWSTMEGGYAADAYQKLKDASERPRG